MHAHDRHARTFEQCDGCNARHMQPHVDIKLRACLDDDPLPLRPRKFSISQRELNCRSRVVGGRGYLPHKCAAARAAVGRIYAYAPH